MKANDLYQTKCSFSNVDLSSELTVLYMPLVGGKATSLYLFLQKEGNQDENKISRLCALLATTIDDVQYCLEKLEQVGLLKTLFNKNTNKFQYNLIKPKGYKEFLENDLLGRLYFQMVGKEQYEITKQIYLREDFESEGYEDITSKIDVSLLNNWNENDESSFSLVKPEKEIENCFDYLAFEQIVTKLTFPLVLRTKENINSICQLGTIYDITPADMAKYIGKYTDYVNKTLDYEGLKKACINCKNVVPNNDYHAHPIEFLSSKQKGMPVSSADKKILDDLMTIYKLPFDLINYLVEYCLNNNKNRLTKNYVEKIATTWIREGIDSLEKAKQAVYNDNAKVVYEYKETSVADQDIDALRKQLFGEEV